MSIDTISQGPGPTTAHILTCTPFLLHSGPHDDGDGCIYAGRHPDEVVEVVKERVLSLQFVSQSNRKTLHIAVDFLEHEQPTS